MNVLVLALQAALVLVVVLVLIELVRLQRAVRTAQLTLPDIDEVRHLNQSIRESAAQAENAARAFRQAVQADIRPVAEESRLVAEQPPVRESLESEPEVPVEATPEQPGIQGTAKRGPRVLSESGRAKYDRVLHLAAQGLNADSIAREVDLTRAEVELMLGSAE